MTRHTPRTTILAAAVVTMMVPHVGASNESLAGAASMFFLSMVVGDSTRVGDVCQLLNVLWESPPTRTCTLDRITTPSETAKIVFMMQSHAIAPTNQTSVWRACEIELLMVYTNAGLSMVMNRSKELAG